MYQYTYTINQVRAQRNAQTTGRGYIIDPIFLSLLLLSLLSLTHYSYPLLILIYCRYYITVYHYSLLIPYLTVQLSYLTCRYSTSYTFTSRKYLLFLLPSSFSLLFLLHLFRHLVLLLLLTFPHFLTHLHYFLSKAKCQIPLLSSFVHRHFPFLLSQLSFPLLLISLY